MEKQIKLYDADTLEYMGSIQVQESGWHFLDCARQDLVKMVTGMPLRAMLQCLISFNMVYDEIEQQQP